RRSPELLLSRLPAVEHRDSLAAGIAGELECVVERVTDQLRGVRVGGNRDRHAPAHAGSQEPVVRIELADRLPQARRRDLQGDSGAGDRLRSSLVQGSKYGGLRAT